LEGGTEALTHHRCARFGGGEDHVDIAREGHAST